MSDKKISGLTPGDPAQPSDQLPVNRGGANFSVTAGTIAGISVVIPGRDGDDGDQGIQGPQGVAGPQGIAGTNGLDGMLGPRGYDGEDGEPGQIIPGIAGPQGIQGVAGPTGLSVTSFIPGIDGEDSAYFNIIPPSIVYSNQSNVYTGGTVQDMDTIRASYWGQAPIIDVAELGTGTDMCDRIASIYSLAAYTSATRAILDARGFTGLQHCDNVDPFGGATRSTKWIFGQVKISMQKYMLIDGVTTDLVPAPSAPGLATATTGGSLAAATQFGIKVAYVNMTGTSLPSAEATITTGAGATNSITVTSPAFSFGAGAYNVYSATPIGSGWKLNNTSGSIPLGTNYVIKTVGAGAVPPASASATNGMFELEGQGDSTEISLDQTTPAASNFLAVYTSVSNVDTYVHDLKLTSGTSVANNAGASIQVVGSTLGARAALENITIVGGGHGIFVGPTISSNVSIRNIRCSNFTQGGSQCVLVQSVGSPTTNIRIQNIEVTNTTWPVSSAFPAAVSLFNCTNCSVDQVRCANNDASTSPNGGCVVVAGGNTLASGSANVNVSNVQCENNINTNCIDVIDFAHDVNVSNVVCRNTNNIAGIGANTAGADGVDIFMAARVNLGNVHVMHRGGPGGTCCPSLEIYESTDVSVTNCEFSDDQSGQGVNINGSTSVALNNITTNRNFNSGITIADSASVVTCNTTTTVVWVSGLPFGPWNAGTPVTIASTVFNIASVTDNHTLILATACSLGASQTFSLFSQDVTIVNMKADDNGQAGTGTGVRTGLAEGLYLSGHSIATVIGGSFSDNAPIAANKHQQYGIRMENSARARIIGADMTNNGGGSNCLFDANNVAGAHTYCDSVKASAIFIDDNITATWTLSQSQTLGPENKVGQANIVASSAAINTTETIIVKTPALAASRLIAGTHFRIVLEGTCTSTVANVSTFTLRWGTNGTTADGTVAALASSVAAASGTNAGFRCVIDLTVRVAGAAATSNAFMELISDGNIGIVATPNAKSVAGTAFNTTTASAILSVAYKSAATTTTSTFTNATIEILNN